MNLVKCIPFVGTAVSGCECINALAHGDIKGFFWKGAETLVDGALDATIVMSGGLTGLITAPIKTAGTKGAAVVVTSIAYNVGVRSLGGAVFDTLNPAQNNANNYRPLFNQNRSGSNKNRQSSTSQKQNSTNSDASAGGHDSPGDDDPSKRKNIIKKTCQQPIRLLRPRYYQKKAASTFPSEFDPQVRTVIEANQRLMERMLHYVEVMHHRNFGAVPVPEAAIRKIFEIIQNSYALHNFYELNRDYMVVQVDNIILGIKADGSQWSVTFTIDADIPPSGSRQNPHFGITIARENASYRTLNHAFVTETIPYGRPGFHQNQSHTIEFVVEEFEIGIDGGSFKSQVKITMLRRKPN